MRSQRVAALLKRAEAGAELACRAHERAFATDGMTLPRGVISYYAGLTLPVAQNLHSWLQQIEQASQRDVTNGTITPFYQPALQVVGDASCALPGQPI